MEAIILAGGKAERLGDAAGGVPKSLVPVAGRPLAAWQIGLLARAGVDRARIDNARACTACHRDIFYSYRKGDRGRLVTVIALP